MDSVGRSSQRSDGGSGRHAKIVLRNAEIDLDYLICITLGASRTFQFSPGTAHARYMPIECMSCYL